MLRWSHRYADAERLYKEILADAPDDRDAIEGLAQTYALAGDFPGALALLDRGIDRFPGDADLRQMLAEAGLETRHVMPGGPAA